MHGSLLIAPVDNDGWLLLLASFVYVRVYDMRFCPVCVCPNFIGDRRARGEGDLGLVFSHYCTTRLSSGTRAGHHTPPVQPRNISPPQH